jgi:hypothetical protein
MAIPFSCYVQARTRATLRLQAVVVPSERNRKKKGSAHAKPLDLVGHGGFEPPT